MLSVDFMRENEYNANERESRMYSTKEAAERLGLSEAHVRKLLAQGEISGRRIGKIWVVLDLNYQRKRRPKRPRGDNSHES